MSRVGSSSPSERFDKCPVKTVRRQNNDQTVLKPEVKGDSHQIWKIQELHEVKGDSHQIWKIRSGEHSAAEPQPKAWLDIAPQNRLGLEIPHRFPRSNYEVLFAAFWLTRLWRVAWL